MMASLGIFNLSPRFAAGPDDVLPPVNFNKCVDVRGNRLIQLRGSNANPAQGERFKTDGTANVFLGGFDPASHKVAHKFRNNSEERKNYFTKTKDCLFYLTNYSEYRNLSAYEKKRLSKGET